MDLDSKEDKDDIELGSNAMMDDTQDEETSVHSQEINSRDTMMSNSSPCRGSTLEAEGTVDNRGTEAKQNNVENHANEGGGEGRGGRGGGKGGGRGRGHFHLSGNQAGRGGYHVQESAGSQGNQPNATTTTLTLQNNNNTAQFENDQGQQPTANGKTDKASILLQQTGANNDAAG